MKGFDDNQQSFYYVEQTFTSLQIHKTHSQEQLAPTLKAVSTTPFLHWRIHSCISYARPTF